MSLYDNFVSYHKQIGLWNSPENFKRYGYVLSPEVFTLNSKMQSQLTEIGLAVKAFQEGAKRLARYSFDKKETGKHTPSMLYRMFREALGGLPFVVSERNVPICKVDLMIDTQGNLKIAEIDAYNPRGIAYAMFLREMHNALGNFDGKKLMPGVFPSL